MLKTIFIKILILINHIVPEINHLIYFFFCRFNLLKLEQCIKILLIIIIKELNLQKKKFKCCFVISKIDVKSLNNNILDGFILFQI